MWSSGIGEGSHSVEFYYEGALTNTTSYHFQTDYQYEFLDYEGNNFYEDNNIQIVKDQHYYENIGKSMGNCIGSMEIEWGSDFRTCLELLCAVLLFCS